MRTLYWECAMGAAGDMLMGSLYELYIEKQKFLDVMNCLLPGVTLAAEAVTRQGICGTHMRVQIHGHEEGCGHHDHHDHHHHHRSPADIDAMIDGFPCRRPSGPTPRGYTARSPRRRPWPTAARRGRCISTR